MFLAYKVFLYPIVFFFRFFLYKDTGGSYFVGYPKIYYGKDRDLIVQKNKSLPGRGKTSLFDNADTWLK